MNLYVIVEEHDEGASIFEAYFNHDLASNRRDYCNGGVEYLNYSWSYELYDIPIIDIDKSIYKNRDEKSQVFIVVFDDGFTFRVEEAYLDGRLAKEKADKYNGGPEMFGPYDLHRTNIVDFEEYLKSLTKKGE